MNLWLSCQLDGRQARVWAMDCKREAVSPFAGSMERLLRCPDQAVRNRLAGTETGGKAATNIPSHFLT